MTNKELNKRFNAITSAIIGKKVEKKMKRMYEGMEIDEHSEALNLSLNIFSEETESGSTVKLFFVREDIIDEYEEDIQETESAGRILLSKEVIDQYEWVIYMYIDTELKIKDLDLAGLGYEQVIEKLKREKLIA